MYQSEWWGKTEVDVDEADAIVAAAVVSAVQMSAASPVDDCWAVAGNGTMVKVVGWGAAIEASVVATEA